MTIICTNLKCLFENNYKAIHARAYALTGSKAEACDLISETYIDIIERGKVYPTTEADFLRWIFNYLHLHKLSRYGRFAKQQHGKERPVSTPKEVAEVAEVEGNIDVQLQTVRDFKRGLDTLDRVLFKLIYEERLSYTKIIKLYTRAGFTIKLHSLQVLARELKQKIKKLKNDT